MAGFLFNLSRYSREALALHRTQATDPAKGALKIDAPFLRVWLGAEQVVVERYNRRRKTWVEVDRYPA